MTSTSYWSFTTATADTTPPTVTAPSPASGATGIPLTSPVSATFSEDVQATTISVVLSTGSTPVAATVTYDASTRIVTLDPTANLSPATTYTVTFSGAEDLSGNTMTSTSWSFTTESAVTTSPSVTTQTPSSGATGVLVASNLTASFSEDIQASTISFVLTDPSSNVVPAVVTYDVASRTVTLDPAANLAPGTTYTATLSGVQDLSDNTMATLSWSFTTAAAISTAPTISAQTPAAGASGVSLIGELTAKFSEPVQASTIQLQLTDPSNTLIPATFNYDAADQTVILQPSVDLAYLTTYTVTLSAAQDLYGNTISAVSWSFTTMAPDTTPPTVVTDGPAPGAVNVAISGDLTATFNEAVQSGTVSFVLTDSSNNVVPATMSYDPRTDSVILDPSANLVPGATYTVTVSGAKDLAGNTMSSVQWSFTTTPAFNTTAPTVTSMSPATGATGVSVLADVTATFSEQVQANTSSLVLVDANNHAVPATVTYDSSTGTVTLDPNAYLSPSRTYLATLSGAENLSGNVMFKLSWSFTTKRAGIRV